MFGYMDKIFLQITEEGLLHITLLVSIGNKRIAKLRVI